MFLFSPPQDYISHEAPAPPPEAQCRRKGSWEGGLFLSGAGRHQVRGLPCLAFPAIRVHPGPEAAIRPPPRRPRPPAPRRGGTGPLLCPGARSGAREGGGPWRAGGGGPTGWPSSGRPGRPGCGAGREGRRWVEPGVARCGREAAHRGVAGAR